MTLTFQIILAVVIVISFIGIVGEKDNKKLQDNMTFTCTISMALMFASLVWL